MVDQQFRVDTEHFIQQIFILQRASCDVSHRKHILFFQTSDIAPAHTPEVPQRAVRPQHFPVAHFIQLRDPDPVFIRIDMLGDDVHCDLCQIHIRTDPGCCGNACIAEHIPDHQDRQFMSIHLICVQVVRYIHKHFIDRIDMNIFW